MLDANVVVFCESRRPVPEGLYRNLMLECMAQEPSDLPDTQQVRLGQTCYCIFTSGTTGMPKAALMTHLRLQRHQLYLYR